MPAAPTPDPAPDPDQRRRRRPAAVGEIRYPAGLPIAERAGEIVAALRDNQVVVVAGETGSGKSTQLPKMCLAAGRGVGGMIGHTQPRRLAARTVAERIAEELGTEVGGAVGYAVRFTDRVGDDTVVKVVTDGILLAEIRRDRRLGRYDTVIVDEAHERSLNIDFILGYLTQLLPARPDLKVVVTSATIDTERFSRHFGGAPVIEVSGRGYPVELRYRPAVDDGAGAGGDEVQAVCDAVRELCAEGPGDILVFLSGEREIRDTAGALAAVVRAPDEILPLYARLSLADQHRVFQPHAGRRVVVATNVAETSLTVPGVRYVVDAGTARISRYSRRTKVQRLPIEAVSRASADQRAGRCGRVAPGVCIRLYAEDDYARRPEFTDPEILRTNLASVLLQMAAIGLGEVESFPFVDPPDRRAVADGVALLEELGAFDPHQRDPRRRLTGPGRKLAQLPLDPRLGRMVLEAGERGCLREVMAIAAGLSIQDPRLRPADRRGEADELHGRFRAPGSDFLAVLNLWDHLRARQRALSSGQFRALCRAELLDHARVREWQDIYSQLRRTMAGLGFPVRAGPPADPDQLHQALLAGLLSHLGVRDGETREYKGARNARFALSPGSSLAKAPPRWVMAAELVETNRLWARVAARIRPEWAERLGAHLVVRTHGEPRWDPGRGSVTADERVTLYGLVLVAARPVDYGRVDRRAARELFIVHALLEGDWDSGHRFLAHNRALVEEVRALEDRARRRDLLVDDEVLYRFYDERVGPDVTSGRHFDAWWKRERQRRPHLLDLTLPLLVDPAAGAVDPADYPDTWHQGDLALPLTYLFAPGAAGDGVTLHVPLTVLNRLRNEGFDWHVPGFRAELVTALLRGLPKPLRRELVPLAATAADVLRRAAPADGDLAAVLDREVRRRVGRPLPAGAWAPERLPDHLRITFRVEDADGRTVAAGKDLEALRARLQHEVRAAIAAAGAGAGIERTGLSSWSFGPLPRTVELAPGGGPPATGYPALVDEGDSVAVRVRESQAEQTRAMWGGTRRLLLLGVPSTASALGRRLDAATRLALAGGPYPSVAEVLEECVECALDDLVIREGGPAWDPAGFAALQKVVRAELPGAAAAAVAAVAGILAARRRIEERLERLRAPALRPAADDVGSQLARLVRPGFVTAAGTARLGDVRRYLSAVERRLDKLAGAPERDRQRMAVVQRLEQDYGRLLAGMPPWRLGHEVLELRWMIEELRVSLFAQQLGTPAPVSEIRIRRAMADVEAGPAGETGPAGGAG